ncbi:hypothetical protein [Labedella endophytica]|uniref:Uncharacterized protein n=1 Tax=Labedella endophytica TaxID=1523160 RepID=A0A433JRW3_9MICO|nr:hypothetical protein [Labedella endophytica]RUR00920.1 hypothetical protein ELQ94_05085 [Labedella endophytica]
MDGTNAVFLRPFLRPPMVVGMGVVTMLRRLVALVMGSTLAFTLAACSTAEPTPTSSETAPTDASRLAEAIDAFTVFNAALDGCRDISRTHVVDEEGAPSTSTPIRTRIPPVVFLVEVGDSLLISKVDTAPDRSSRGCLDADVPSSLG